MPPFLNPMNPFDNLQSLSFGITTQLMGYDASWTPIAGGGEKTARVLFKDPSEVSELAGVEYNPLGFMMEYQQGDFDGLFESARSGDVETVRVNGQDYYVKSVKAFYDGKTLRARLEVK